VVEDVVEGNEDEGAEKEDKEGDDKDGEKLALSSGQWRKIRWCC
jgi:hypothetical protein